MQAIGNTNSSRIGRARVRAGQGDFTTVIGIGSTDTLGVARSY